MANYIQNDIGVCPYCKRRIHASYNKVLNLSYRQDLRAEIKSKTLNTSTCLFCDEVFRFETELFAFDLKNKFAIIVNQKDAYRYYSHLRSDIYKLALGDGYKLRYVETCLEMIEKVLLFESGIDDRALELAKQMHFADIMDNLKEHHRFLVTDITDSTLVFTLYDDHDRSVQAVEADKSLLCDMCTNGTQSAFAVYEKIDNNWAREYLNGGKTNE